MGLLQLHFSQKLLLPETTTSTPTTAVARNAMGSSVTTSQLDGQQHCQNTHSLSSVPWHNFYSGGMISSEISPL